MPEELLVASLHKLVDAPGEMVRRVVRDLKVPTRKDPRGWLLIRKKDASAVLSEVIRRGGKKKPQPPKP